MDNQEESPQRQEDTIKQQLKEKRRSYYEKNKYRLCNKTLNAYPYNKIEKVRERHSREVKEYTERYPFEEYADPYIKKQLSIFRIYSWHSSYADCYDAGMMAYLYSIHRCAEMSYAHTSPYIKKLIRIYIICALVISDDARNLCKENDFRVVRLNAEASAGRY